VILWKLDWNVLRQKYWPNWLKCWKTKNGI